VVVYRATLDVPGKLAWFVPQLLAAERHRRGTPAGQSGADLLLAAGPGLRWFHDPTSPDAPTVFFERHDKRGNL
jgi:hypothetical protein